MQAKRIISTLCFAGAMSACIEEPPNRADPALSESSLELHPAAASATVVLTPPPCPGNPTEGTQWLLPGCETPPPYPMCPNFNRNSPNSSFCSLNCPCTAGEGDCDSDQQCAAGLVCGADNGARYGLPASWDVCVAPARADPECYSECLDGCLDDGHSLPRQCVQQCRALCT